MDDAQFTALMVGAGFEDPMGDLWEIAAADTDPVGSEVDPRMEARCEASIAAHEGDLLTGSLWWETAEAEDRQGHYRDQHPFPLHIDPDEEKPW